jgi:hypothetical protein
VELVLLLICWALALLATPHHHTQRLLPLLVKGQGFTETPISLLLRLYLADLDEGDEWRGAETADDRWAPCGWMTTGNRAQLGPVIDYSSMIVVLL